MRAWLVVLAACGAPPASPQPLASPPPPEPTGPEVVVPALGAIALAVDDAAVYWLAPAGTGSGSADISGIWRADLRRAVVATRLAPIMPGARGLALDATHVYWGDGDYVEAVPKAGGAAGRLREVAGSISSIAVGADQLELGVDASGTAELVRTDVRGGSANAVPLDGAEPIVVAGAAGTSTMLYQVASDAKVAGAPVDGGVSALAADGDDVFAGNTAIYEKVGAGRLVKLGPAGGPVTAIAVDATYVYWAIAAGDREPAIYRALRKKPELELVTKIGAASALAVAGAYLYWLDPSDGAIHRIRR